jgi:two-component system sensor histidine kinase YesM
MTDWHYLQLTPYSSIRALSSRSMQQFLYISVIAIPLFIILAFIFSKYTSKRIHHVIGNLDAIAKHHIIEDDMYAKSRNDFENLNNSFNKMVKRLDMLLEERYQFGMEIKSLEIKMLQSQINPHFLYNSLNIINNLGLKNNIPEVSMTVDALAKFYSLSLSKGKDTISIASEIEIVRAYMTIQNMRFGDCAEFIVNVPQNLMEYKTPKLILQPIVENALWHGILESESRKGTIKLDVKLDDGDILFIVEDDGKGMTQEKLQESLQEDLSDVQHGYGTKNINDRLTIMYGDKYGLSYKSDLGKGTIAYIRIPLIK